MATPILNVTEITVASDGQILERSGTSLFHAQSNYANLILLNLEDGVGLNSTTFINFTPKDATLQTAYTSHWFFADFQGFITKVIDGQTRHFGQFAIRVPSTVLQNNRPNRVTNNVLTFIQRYGESLLGVFNYLSNLNETHPIVEIDSVGTYGSVSALNVAFPADISTLGNFGVVNAFPETGIYTVVEAGEPYFVNEWISATEEDYNNASGAVIELGNIASSMLQAVKLAYPATTLETGTVARAYSLLNEQYEYAIVSLEEDITTGYQWVPYTAQENTIYVETLYAQQFTYKNGLYNDHTNLIAYVVGDQTELGISSGFYVIERNQYCSNPTYTSQGTCEGASGTWTDAYEWTLKEGSLSGYLYTKQYNVGEIMVQAGQANPLDLPSISLSQTQVILQILSNLQQRIDNLTFNIEQEFVATDVDQYYDQTGVVGNPIENTSQMFVRTGLANEYIEYQDLKANINVEQNDRLDGIDDKIDDMLDGTQNFTAITIANEDLQTVLSGLENTDIALDGRLDTLEPKVSTLETEMDTAQSDIIGLDGRLDIAEPKISTLESEVQALEDKTVGITRVSGETIIEDEEVRVSSSVGEINVYAKNNLYLESDSGDVYVQAYDGSAEVRAMETNGEAKLRGDNAVVQGDVKVTINTPLAELAGSSVSPSTDNSIVRKKYVDDQIATAVSIVYRYKGSVAFESLPTTGQAVGDTYNITNDFTLGGLDYLAGTDVAWNGTAWDAKGSSIPDASDIDYTDTHTLGATNVQTAIDKTNDKIDNLTAEDIEYLTGVSVKDELDDKVDKVTGSSLVTDANISKLTALDNQATLDTKFGNKIDKDFSAYDNATVDDTDIVIIGEGSVAKKATVGALKSHIIATSGEFDATVDYKASGLGAYKSAMVTYFDVTLVTNGDFKCSIKTTQDTKQIFYVLFPTVTATNTLRLSTNDGVTFANVLKNGATLRANIVSGQMVKMQWNGTNFIADIQGDVEILERYTSKISSTYGQFNPHDNGVPLVKEVLGRTIPALSNLVTNGGNPFTVITGWTSGFGSHSVIGGDIVSLGSTANRYTQSYFQSVNNGTAIYYLKMRYLTSHDIGKVWLGDRQTGSYFVDNSPSLTYKVLTHTVSSTGIIQFTMTRDYLTTANADGKTTNIDYAMMFNLTASHGVTSTTGTAYDNAVADIEAMLALNGGYITSTDTTHVENVELRSHGVQEFDKTQYATDYAYKIVVSPSQQYTWSVSALYKTYDAQLNELSSGTATTVTTGTNTRYIAFSGIANKDTFMMNKGATALTYAPYNSETQKFNDTGRMSKLPNGVADKLRYDNGAYVLDRYVQEVTLTSGMITGLSTSATNIDLVRISTANLTGIRTTGSGTQGMALMEGKTSDIGRTTSFSEFDNVIYNNYFTSLLSTLNLDLIVTKGTYANLAAAQSALAGTKIWYQLATPLLAQSIIDVDGTLIQESVTTLEQLQDIPTTYDIEFSMNTEQSVKTLVQRDKIQQQEIDSNEQRLDTVEPKVTTLESEMDTVQGALSTAQDDIASLENSAEMITNKVTAFQTIPTDTAYPSEKLVKDSLDLKTTDSTLATVAKTGAYADLTGKPAWSATLLGSRTNDGTISVANWSDYDDIRMMVNSTGGNRTSVQIARNLFVYSASNNPTLMCLYANIVASTPNLTNVRAYMSSGNTTINIEREAIVNDAQSVTITIYGIKYLGV